MNDHAPPLLRVDLHGRAGLGPGLAPCLGPLQLSEFRPAKLPTLAGHQWRGRANPGGIDLTVRIEFLDQVLDGASELARPADCIGEKQPPSIQVRLERLDPALVQLELFRPGHPGQMLVGEGFRADLHAALKLDLHAVLRLELL